MKTFEEVKTELLKNKKIKEEYDKLEAEFELAASLIEKRLARGYTQAALAKKIGTKQSAIARLESGNSNPSMSFLSKVAKALGAKLKISIS